jgi:hypothetical protein
VILRAGGASGILALALCASAAEAELRSFGSDLSAAASIAEARQSDTAYWQTVAAGASSAGVAPAAGSIRSFKLKGVALSQPVAGTPGGETLFHLQALRPLIIGAFQISPYRVLISSQGFNVPQKAGGNEQTISTYEPENFCVAKGDVLAFNTVGGWDGIPAGGPYPRGTPLQIFAAAPGALVSQFNGADQTNNGDILTPDHVRGLGQELLMQLTLATGNDAAAPCPTGTAAAGAEPGQPAVRAQTAARPAGSAQATKILSQRATVTSKGSLKVALFCSPASADRYCNGIVRVLSRERKPRVLAVRVYTIAAGKTRKAALRLSPAGRKLFAKANRRLRVRIQTVKHSGGVAHTVTKSFVLGGRA